MTVSIHQLQMLHTLQTARKLQPLVERIGKPTFIDLFAGAGGFSLGFIRAGWHGLAALENDTAAATTYWSNLCGPHSRWIGAPKTLRKRDRWLGKQVFNPLGSKDVDVLICDDIHNWTGEKILAEVGRDFGDVGCVMGGPPCQGFSHAGRRNVHDPRNSLVWEFARLIHEIKPYTFVMENVPGITTMTTPSGQNLFQMLIKSFEDEGFLAISQKFEEALKHVDSAASGVKVKLADEPVQLELFKGW